MNSKKCAGRLFLLFYFCSFKITLYVQQLPWVTRPNLRIKCTAFFKSRGQLGSRERRRDPLEVFPPLLGGCNDDGATGRSSRRRLGKYWDVHLTSSWRRFRSGLDLESGLDQATKQLPHLGGSRGPDIFPRLMAPGPLAG